MGEHCSAIQLKKMVEQILDMVPRLAQHRYGNYVVQHLLEHGRKEDKKHIINEIRCKLVDYSKDRCSSNVVEKCIEVSTSGEHAPELEKERAGLMLAVLGEESNPNPPLYQMMEDRFGNYIVQRVIEYSRATRRTSCAGASPQWNRLFG